MDEFSQIFLKGQKQTAKFCGWIYCFTGIGARELT